MNAFCFTSWNTSAPHWSQLYAFTTRCGFTSDTRVTMPRTVTRCPIELPLLSRMDCGFCLLSGLMNTVLQTLDLHHEPHERNKLWTDYYRRVRVAGNWGPPSPSCS